MGGGGANTVPLVTPYKMGNFDLSHRYALAPCFLVRLIPNSLIPYQQTNGFWLVFPRSGSFGILSCE
jgi:12-oxophytodienoic acid reductase